MNLIIKAFHRLIGVVDNTLITLGLPVKLPHLCRGKRKVLQIILAWVLEPCIVLGLLHSAEMR